MWKWFKIVRFKKMMVDSFHQMETFSASLALCVGNSPVWRGVGLDIFFDLRPPKPPPPPKKKKKKRFGKQSRRRLFETQSHSWWRKCSGGEVITVALLSHIFFNPRTYPSHKSLRWLFPYCAWRHHGRGRETVWDAHKCCRRKPHPLVKN